MAGNIVGGKLAAQTNLEKYGEDFYSNIGKKGGALGHTGGTYGDSEWAKTIGKQGGANSKVGYKLIKKTRHHLYYLHKLTGKTLKVRITPSAKLQR